MALYSFRCPTCGQAQDVFKRIADRDANPPVCCGIATERQLTACMVSVPKEVRYLCPVTEQLVTSERQRRNIMAEHRLRDANDMKPAQVIAAKKKRTADNQALADQLTVLPEDLKSQVFSEA